MNVLFLTHSFPRHRGDAAGSFILRLAQALGKQGISVHVVAPAAPGLAAEDEIDGISVERFRYAPRRFERLAYTGTMAEEVKRSWTARLALVGFLGGEFASAVLARRRITPQVVHAHWWFPGGLVGTWMNGLSHLPLVTTMHGTDVRLARSRAAQPLFRHVIRHSRVVTTVSRWLAEQTKQIVPECQPEVAPMPVSTELFVPGNGQRDSRLLFVGRLNAQKGIEHLIRALPLVKQPVSLDVVGDGPSRSIYTSLASELGVTDRIRWHGQLGQDKLPSMYQQASALVAPSIEEGLGLAAVEALLCETPVIAANSGGIVDVVQDGRTGLLVPPSDPTALATAVDALLTRSDRGAELGKAGRLYALSLFAPESVARRYAGIYQQASGATPT